MTPRCLYTAQTAPPFADSITKSLKTKSLMTKCLTTKCLNDKMSMTQNVYVTKSLINIIGNNKSK